MLMKAGAALLGTRCHHYQDPKASPTVGSCPSTHLVPPAAFRPLSGLHPGKEVLEGGPMEPLSAGDMPPQPSTSRKAPANLSSICRTLPPSAQTCPGMPGACSKPFPAPARATRHHTPQAHPHASHFHTPRVVGALPAPLWPQL